MVWPLMNDVWRLEIPGFTFVTQPAAEGYVDALYAYAARADFNRSRSTISYRLVENPAWLKIDEKSGLISGTAPGTGDSKVVVEAFDGKGEIARQSFRLHILPLL